MSSDYNGCFSIVGNTHSFGPGPRCKAKENKASAHTASWFCGGMGLDGATLLVHVSHGTMACELREARQLVARWALCLPFTEGHPPPRSECTLQLK